MVAKQLKSAQSVHSQLSIFQPVKTWDNDQKLEATAVQLSILFSDIQEVPPRYKNRRDKKKVSKPSLLDIRFVENIKHWKELILIMLDTLDHDLAWRFINLKPAKSNPKENKTTNQDFIDFVGYLSLRRDKQKCDDDELGRLSMLLMAFQREVEKG